MKAIVYDFSIPKYVASTALGKWFPSLYYGKLSALSMRDIEEPELPGDDWIKLRPTYAGVCGSDMGAILGKTSPSLTPFNSFPSVLGHEILGVVTEVGGSVKNVEIGQRIAVDPYIGCEVRGRDELCPSCADGLPMLCRFKGGDENFGPGMILGFSHDLPGGWAESVVIHESMIIPLEEGVSDKVASLIEPLSVGLHAVLRKLPKSGDRILVIGGGMIAYSVIAAIRLLDIDCHITQISLHDYQKEMGLKLGVDEGLMSRDQLRNSMLQLPYTSEHKPVIGREVYLGGYDFTYDCIGSAQSIDDSLRITKESGNVVLVGGAGEIKNTDWTFVWTNELSVIGTHAYSKKEVWQGETISTQQLLLDLIAKQPDYPLESLVTHEFALDDYEEAIVANLQREKYQSIKTLFKL